MFSANHRQHLLVAFKHLDESLAGVVRCLEPAAAARVFPPYDDVASDAEHTGICNLVANVRTELRAFMSTQHMQIPQQTLSSWHAASARASLALTAAMELDASHAKGYGALSADERDALDALSDRLRVEITRLIEALAREPGNKA